MKPVYSTAIVLLLIACKTIQVPDHSPRINLNKILVIPSEQDNNTIVINKSKRNENFVEFNLKYEGSGINVIEGIKSGEIWDHAVVVFDNEGNEIGREPINFQAFSIRTMQTTVVEKDKQFILSEDGSLFGKDSTPRTSVSSTIDPNFQHKIYSDKDSVPQIIKLKSIPQVGTFVSVLVELTYVSPFLDELCDSDSSRDCPEIRKSIFNKINKRNTMELNRLQNSIRSKLTSSTSNDGEIDFYTTQESELKFHSLVSKSNPMHRPRNFSGSESYCDSTEECRVSMQLEIEKINSKNQSFPYLTMAKLDKNRYMKSSGIFGLTLPFFDQSVTYDGNRLYYREWNLVTLPRYFRVTTVSKSSQPNEMKEEGTIDLNESEEPNLPKPKTIYPIEEGGRNKRR